jgi:hypothetical protein
MLADAKYPWLKLACVDKFFQSGTPFQARCTQLFHVLLTDFPLAGKIGDFRYTHDLLLNSFIEIAACNCRW